MFRNRKVIFNLFRKLPVFFKPYLITFTSLPNLPMRILLFFLIIIFAPSLIFAHGGTRNLEFIKNEGQWKEGFLFKSNTGNSDVFLEQNGFTYVIGTPDNFQRIHDFKHNLNTTPPTLKYHAYKVSFTGGNTQKITGSKPLPQYYNYLLGNDASRWKSGIHPMQAVDYKEVYKGVDLHIASADGQMKYDFLVAANADPAQIKMHFEGIDGISIKNKKLQIKTSVGTVEELAPFAYQYINNERKEVACDYTISGSDVQFSLPEGYDVSKTLIIDPTVVFATYSGSTFDNWGFTATYDNAGNFYAGGIVGNASGGSGYPVTTGAFQVIFAGGGMGGGNGFAMPCDMAISKYNPTGTALIYATYLGGSDNDQPHSMVVDNAGNLIIAGRTYSNNFPMTPNAYDATANGLGDIVVAKLNSTGTALLGATYMGGTGEDGANISALYGTITSLKHDYGDDARSEVIVDDLGNIYVAGASQSSDFPTTANATQSASQGLQDGVVFKLTPDLQNLTWSTYLGGSGNDAAYVLALSPAQNSLYVAGGTASSNFPVGAGGLFPTYQGGTADGYILKFQNSGSYSFQNGTFIGKSNYDQCFGVQTDADGSVYAMGQTLGGTFPVTAGVYSNPGSSQFIIKLDANLATNVFSTVFGSGNSTAANISPVAFLIDTCKQIYISGWGGPLASNGGSTTGMPVTANAAQATTDGSDFYFIVLGQNAQNLLYGTFYGGSGLGEHVDGGTSRFNKAGVIYQAICGGCGGSSAFPTTPGVWSNTNNSANCNLVSLKIAFELGGVTSKAIANPDTLGCPPFSVQFQNLSFNSTTFVWIFGDGSQNDSTSTAPLHVYTQPGVYTAMLIATNPLSCLNTVDTDFVTIIVDTNSIAASFSALVTDSCGPYAATFTNTSQFGTMPGAASWTTFHWDFGDGTTFNGLNPGNHVFANPGIYTVTLLMKDSTACNSPDSVSQTLNLQNFFLTAAFNAPDSLCLNEGVVFANASSNAATISWNFGDGHTDTAASPVYTYSTPGVYEIVMIASNPNSCNKTDTARATIKIFAPPIADFSHAPIIPIANEPVQFTSLSTNAVTYKWNFGDFTGSSLENPTHLYKKTNRFRVCLEVRSKEGCIDSICKFVDAEIHAAIDVPTGFTPNGDGNNDVLYVRGAAVATLDFKVYNRWGQLVFETTNINKGWDGIYKGKPQEMEAYGWTLSASFIDGTVVNKAGNVTLMR